MWGEFVLPIIVAVIAALPPTLVAYAALRATKGTHKLVNSRMDQLLKAAKVEATEDERERVRQEIVNND